MFGYGLVVFVFIFIMRERKLIWWVEKGEGSRRTWGKRKNDKNIFYEKTLKIKNIKIFYIHECFVCMYICITCVSLMTLEVIRPPGTELRGSCKPPGCWELNSSCLEKHPVLLTSESCLQPHLYLRTCAYLSIG